jgi:hypothetical protein
MVAHPRLLRISARSRYDGSALGDSLREVHEQDRQALVEDLMLHGYRTATEADRRRIEIVADAFNAICAASAAGILEGRYDLDEALDVIMLLVRGLRPLIDQQARPDGSPATTNGHRKD